MGLDDSDRQNSHYRMLMQLQNLFKNNYFKSMAKKLKYGLPEVTSWKSTTLAGSRDHFGSQKDVSSC